MHPLEDYARALADAGFLVEALREPPAADALVARDPAARRWQRLPNFLMGRALKPAPPASDTL